jgi:ATP-dependent RNA helicase DeaD
VRGDAAEVAAAARRAKMPPTAEAPTPAASSLADWAPPAEPGDDQPIFQEVEAPTRPKLPGSRTGKAPRRDQEKPEDAGIRWTERRHDETQDSSFAEIFVSVGRRDGVKAADLQHVLTDIAKIPASHTGSIRVRDRNAFVSVKREMLDRALAALNGAAIAGKVVQAEPAKPRSS